MKNFRIGSWLNLFAAVAGIVGLIALIVSNSISSAYALKSAGLVTVMAIGGILLALVAIWSPTKFGNHDFISTAAVVGAIALFSAVIGAMILERILMIAGLFSYNSQNMTGWSVFYAIVVCAVALVIANVALIIGAFTKSVKEKA
ncbi:MAG: hypothetical protein IKD62_05655 [Oscillospiraceae bacterium]|jgi:hypothetical protein|nr:hypothetical protein [Clostridia bacterium]MBR2592436.1 hypothetical protein [Oscillospiraceae bacterium]MBR3178127.1 hypothetical protein [Clostridia bacterium]MBR3404248.1 hypothetical protein [Bacillota bacterium]